jgi:DNA polymerase-1
LLNAPSSKSIYAKPLKRCFKAKEDFVIYTADLSALEDRVISNLSGDVNKCNVFKEGLDGHSLNACGYYSEEIEKVIGKFNNNVDLVKSFMQKNDEGNSIIKDIRQKSKGPTFKLALTKAFKTPSAFTQ